MSAVGNDELLEEIGPWTEIKHEIVRKYARTYSVNLSAQTSPRFQHVYVDAFAGAGRYLSRQSGEAVSGSAEIALGLDPPFREYHLIDLDEPKVARLERIAAGREDGVIHHGDCNRVLIDDIAPRLRYEDYRRGLCILDPYGLQLDWSTVESLAGLWTTELFINFPTMDINRNVLRKDPGSIDLEQARRPTRFWGDESWRTSFYAPRPQLSLFEPQGEQKTATNEQVAEAYRQRLKDMAGFTHVPRPIPMRNSTKAIVYYLFFAAHHLVAGETVEQIFSRYR